MGRARLLRFGHGERLAHDLGDDLRARDASVPFNDRAQDADEIYVLVGFLVHALDVGLPGEGDEWGAIQEGVGHRGDQIRRSWAKGPQTYAGPAGQAAVGIGHVRPALLVADGDELNR